MSWAQRQYDKLITFFDNLVSNTAASCLIREGSITLSVRVMSTLSAVLVLFTPNSMLNRAIFTKPYGAQALSLTISLIILLLCGIFHLIIFLATKEKNGMQTLCERIPHWVQGCDPQSMMDFLKARVDRFNVSMLYFVKLGVLNSITQCKYVCEMTSGANESSAGHVLFWSSVILVVSLSSDLLLALAIPYLGSWPYLQRVASQMVQIVWIYSFQVVLVSIGFGEDLSNYLGGDSYEDDIVRYRVPPVMASLVVVRLHAICTNKQNEPLGTDSYSLGSQVGTVWLVFLSIAHAVLFDRVYLLYVIGTFFIFCAMLDTYVSWQQQRADWVGQTLLDNSGYVLSDMSASFVAFAAIVLFIATIPTTHSIVRYSLTDLQTNGLPSVRALLILVASIMLLSLIYAYYVCDKSVLVFATIFLTWTVNSMLAIVILQLFLLIAVFAAEILLTGKMCTWNPITYNGAHPVGFSQSLQNVLISDNDHLKPLNMARFVGLRHSFHTKPQFAAFAPEWSIDHPSIPWQLSLGFRKLEFVVHYREDTKRFNVYHHAVFDFASSCKCLEHCFQQVKQWIHKNPQHTPILVMLIPGGFSLTSTWCSSEYTRMKDALLRLEKQIRHAFKSDQIVWPIDIMKNLTSVKDAVQLHGWPSVHELNGKVIFVLALGTLYRASADVKKSCISDYATIDDQSARVMFQETIGDLDLPYACCVDVGGGYQTSNTFPLLGHVGIRGTFNILHESLYQPPALLEYDNHIPNLITFERLAE